MSCIISKAKTKTRALWLTGLLLAQLNTAVYAMGNHPESDTCPTEKPYYVYCADSIHGLQGWFGACYASRQLAEDAALAHAKQQHNGDTRWTGVQKIRPLTNGEH